MLSTYLILIERLKESKEINNQKHFKERVWNRLISVQLKKKEEEV